MKTVSTAVTAVPASIAKNVDTAIDGITRAFVHKDLRDGLTKILPTFPSTFADPNPRSGAFLTFGSGIGEKQPGSYFRDLKKNYFLGQNT